MGDEEAKRIILARRARFVAAALAGLNAAMCGGKSDSAEFPPDVVPDEAGSPRPCLTQSFPQDAAKDGDADADAPDDADAQPQPCLTPLPEDAG